MAQLEWDRIPDRTFEYGVDRGVLYVDGGPGVPWNGLIRVDETPQGGEASPIYMDGKIVMYRRSKETYSGTIAAITYPDEFEACDGYLQDSQGLIATHQRRKKFNLSYRTKVANPLNENLATRIHLIYEAEVAPVSRQNSTNSQTVNPLAFSWGIFAIPQSFPGYRPTAHFIVDSRLVDPGAFEELQRMLYGTEDSEPLFPSVSQLSTILNLTGYQFEVINDKLMLVPGVPAWVLGNEEMGIYRITKDSPLIPVDGKPGIYQYEVYTTNP